MGGPPGECNQSSLLHRRIDVSGGPVAVDASVAEGARNLLTEAQGGPATDRSSPRRDPEVGAASLTMVSPAEGDTVQRPSDPLQEEVSDRPAVEALETQGAPHFESISINSKCLHGSSDDLTTRGVHTEPSPSIVSDASTGGEPGSGVQTSPATTFSRRAELPPAVAYEVRWSPAYDTLSNADRWEIAAIVNEHAKRKEREADEERGQESRYRKYAGVACLICGLCLCLPASIAGVELGLEKTLWGSMTSRGFFVGCSALAALICLILSCVASHRARKLIDQSNEKKCDTKVAARLGKEAVSAVLKRQSKKFK